MMKLKLLLFSIFVFLTAFFADSQSIEKFDIVSYSLPTGWIKENGNDFVAYTISNKTGNEYARILIFESLKATGNINADFDTEWKELVQPNYHPGEFTNTNVSDYKDGWVSKIGVAPFKYQNSNHVALLLTQVKAQTKMSFVFITNTTKYQTVFEDFGSSLVFGDKPANTAVQNKPVQNENPVTIQLSASQAPQQNQPAITQSSGFQYTTSNFDDGWTATIQKDWVLVEKGNARVYLFYAVPYNSNNFSGTGVMDRDYYWDNYVSRQFNIASKQYNDAGEFIGSFMPKYIEGPGTDPATGRSGFVAMALSVSPNTAHLTVAVYPDEASFRQAFPKANDKFTSDLAAMSRYNKFAIGRNDVSGTWQNGNTETAQWYYVSPSGYENYAGMTLAATSTTFSFFDNGTYTSIHNGATGAVGNMGTFQQEYKGNYTVSNWMISASGRYEGKTDHFDASFTALRGGRILKLNNNAGQKYDLVKVK